MNYLILFSFLYFCESSVYLKSWDGKYVSTEETPVKADKLSKMEASALDISFINNMTLTIQGKNGLYITALENGTITLCRKSSADWDKFNVIYSANSSIIGLKSVHGWFISANENGELVPSWQCKEREHFMIVKAAKFVVRAYRFHYENIVPNMFNIERKYRSVLNTRCGDNGCDGIVQVSQFVFPATRKIHDCCSKFDGSYLPEHREELFTRVIDRFVEESSRIIGHSILPSIAKAYAISDDTIVGYVQVVVECNQECRHDKNLGKNFSAIVDKFVKTELKLK